MSTVGPAVVSFAMAVLIISVTSRLSCALLKGEAILYLKNTVDSPLQGSSWQSTGTFVHGVFVDEERDDL